MSVELIEELKKKTVPQLKSYAKQKNIDIFGSNTKKEIIEVIMSWMPQENKTEKKTVEKKTKIALYTSKNLHWSSVGSLKTGYNIVTKEEADKWLAHKDVRIASPDEVAKFYGKNK